MFFYFLGLAVLNLPWYGFADSYQSKYEQADLRNSQNQDPVAGMAPNLFETQVKKFPCPNPNCKSVFKSQRYLNGHMRYLCGQPRKYKCPYCPYRSVRVTDVKRHAKHRHSNQNVDLIRMRYYKYNL